MRERPTGQPPMHGNRNAALLQTIKSAVISVLCLLLLANIAVHFLVSPSGKSNLNQTAAANGAKSTANESQKSSLTSSQQSKALSKSNCGIDRRWAKNLSLEEFRSTYRLKRPLLLQFERGAADWLVRDSAWSLDRLAGQFGSYDALAGRPVQIVQNGGRGQERVNFGRFLSDIRNASAGEKRYIFSREFFQSTHMDSTLKFPSIMAYNSRDHDLFLFLGGNNSGVSFHRHADAWNAVVGGRKRWFLYPGDRAPPGGVHHAFEPADWLARVRVPMLTNAQQKVAALIDGSAAAVEPLECVQVAGEILYIPEGFYHATINLEPTLAIGIQNVKPLGATETAFYELNAKPPTEADAIASKILKSMPYNTEVLHKQAMSRKRQEKFQEAEKLLERALSLDSSFLVAMLDLAEIKWKYFSKIKEAQALYTKALELNPNLWEVYGKYGEFLAYQTGELETAVEMVEKATQLQSNELVLWQLLRSIHDFAGNETAVSAADVMIDKLSVIDDQLYDF
ncbi:hypothetical protein BOX15_Mlig004490g1 [Macrostomum lignano]|uniref:JmjC domain-containing protein n=1 Tax=Macrostomum lignano TaxID=282301 RepID=A0A267DZ76_9PLAT|nr:hypothetical protein BOX15_Mlig004490g1 [Macrostomum lignano]